MAAASSQSMNKSASATTLRESGQATVSGAASGTLAMTKDSPIPNVPKYLSVHALTRRRKLSKSSGNLHGYMAEDYSQINWPMPKMFGKEKYGYSLIDIEDPRYIKECAVMSKKLVRLSYDQQIIDLEWRKTYKKLLDAEHRKATLPENIQDKTKKLFEKEISDLMKYLLELQEQKDLYDNQIKDNYARCDDIKGGLKKETDLEDLRTTLEKQTKDKIHTESPFWRTKFNTRSQHNARGTLGSSLEF